MKSIKTLAIICSALAMIAVAGCSKSEEAVLVNENNRIEVKETTAGQANTSNSSKAQLEDKYFNVFGTGASMLLTGADDWYELSDPNEVYYTYAESVDKGYTSQYTLLASGEDENYTLFSVEVTDDVSTPLEDILRNRLAVNIAELDESIIEKGITFQNDTELDFMNQETPNSCIKIIRNDEYTVMAISLCNYLNSQLNSTIASLSFEEHPEYFTSFKEDTLENYVNVRNDNIIEATPSELN